MKKVKKGRPPLNKAFGTMENRVYVSLPKEAYKWLVITAKINNMVIGARTRQVILSVFPNIRLDKEEIQD